jgi:hypothetical protein
MIEALTPQLLMVGLLEATLLASVLGLLVSAVVLLAYRRRVLRAMETPGRPLQSPAEWSRAAPAAPMPHAGLRVEDALRATQHATWTIVAGGGSFALVFASAATAALPDLQSAAGFALALWACSWPIVPALWISAPAARRNRLVWASAPFALWALVSLVSWLASTLAPARFGVGIVEYFYVIHPPQTLAAWVLVNAPPTLMWWLFSNRRLRAIGPLVIGFATALAAGGSTLLMWLFLTRSGLRWFAQSAALTGLPEPALLALLMSLLIIASGGAGWVFMQRARRAYRAKRANDRTLMLDALWLLFAIWYAMILVLAGIAWFATAPVAVAVCRMVTRAMQRQRPARTDGAHSLVFLRVFSLGRRSDQLFDRITRYWRHLASVDLICGPDVVHSTVAPHQLMDFLSGRLASHFVADPETLERGLQARDLAPDDDGRYRVNSFFCHADTWTHVLPALVGGAFAVLMDLRRLTPRNSGCVLELQHLIATVPIARIVLVTDASTDQGFLEETLSAAWRAMPIDSPNRQTTSDNLTIHSQGSDDESVRRLLSLLCAATRAQMPSATTDRVSLFKRNGDAGA